MGALAERLVPFLWILGKWRGTVPNLGDHLMFPAGASGLLRGSEFGRSLWQTTEAVALLDLIEADPEFTAAFAHAQNIWDKRDEARRTVASACGQWAERPVRAEVFAQQIEASLWDSLRRTDITYFGVTVIEGVTVSQEVVNFGYSRYVMRPVEAFVATAFARARPDFFFRLPSGPFALVVANIAVPRPYYGGGSGFPFARIVANEVRDAIWLITGSLAPLGMGVVWEEHPIPILNEPCPFEAERDVADLDTPVVLDGPAAPLTAMSQRLAMLDGNEGVPSGLDTTTHDTLRLLRAQVAAAIHAASTEACLLQVNAAIEGALASSRGEEERVRARFAFMCGANQGERRQLRETADRLDAIRDAVAHGSRPLNRQMAAFIGQPVADPSADENPWSPGVSDPSPKLARQRALDLLRRFYRAWLVAALESTAQGLNPRWTRAQVIDMIDRARRAGGQPPDPIADQALLDLNTTMT